LKYAKIGLPVTNQSRRDLRRATHLAAEQPIQSQIVDIVPKGSNPSLTATFSLVSVARRPKTCQLRANFGRDFPVAGIEQSRAGVGTPGWLSVQSSLIHTPGMDMKVRIDEGLVPNGRSKIQITGNCAATCCTIVSPIC
jgi:hypothetical protein